MQEKEHRKKHRAYNVQKKRSSRLPLHAITLDVLPTKQHEHFLRSFNMTGTTGRSVCFVLRRHDPVLELAITPGRFALIHFYKDALETSEKTGPGAKPSSKAEQPPSISQHWKMCPMIHSTSCISYLMNSTSCLILRAGLYTSKYYRIQQTKNNNNKKIIALKLLFHILL